MKKKTDGFTQREKAAMEELCGAMLELLTKPYEYHMIGFLCDAENYFGMTKQDFARWDDKVLLILSKDDTTFNQAPVRVPLIAIMPRPTVVIKPDRWASGADGQAGAICQTCDGVYQGANVKKKSFFCVRGALYP